MDSGTENTDGKDVFISYSHSDSKEIAKLLGQELSSMGVEVWLDDIKMSIGSSIRESIDDGLTQSEYGVVILSESYFEGTSEWELNGLVEKHTNEEDVILPLWHGVDHDYVYQQSPSLADLIAEEIDKKNVQTVAASIYQIVEDRGGDNDEWGGDIGGGQKTDFIDIDIRFQGRFDPEVGKEVTVESWRNHNAPNLTALEATEIRDEDREIDYTSSSKGTIMTVKRIDDEPLNGIISDIQEIRSGKTEFTIRVEESRLEELSDDRDDYKSGFVQ
ncbi:toll/interleukin-1 receptor domain-containing protein [Haloarcula sp. S1CR25-12]|uniref:Toll/interleukin-1 receptor domain-containing protein n=1 Tax=Haloarcula saliterrae TaxID=2950534 RepID=A0ABU2FHY3_9EURY|nr:toll/interleukin-1 receptor domain-containing protein [Haloarcula sp. S1CR25-12]MDS0261867.1 toll/interleukin-1 receptor domain-containing protein [Haloarcula sp. S1CR25-12]